MFILSKNAKFGIKVFCLVDPATMYLSNADVYLGKQDGQTETNLGESVVLNLSASFLQSGRAIITDNFFKSSQLGKKLWDAKTHLLGTIRKNRSGNPKDFIAEPLQMGKVQFAFGDQETLLKFQAKKSKQVCLYSTLHHNEEIHRSGKPKMITDYNQTKFAVDIFDEMTGLYAYKPPTNRWPLRLFMNFLVDGGATNAYVLFCGSSTRREFIHKLADQLMRDQKAERSTSQYWMNNGFRDISSIYNSMHEKMSHGGTTSNWCHICNKIGRGDHIRSCSKCERPACEEHTLMLLVCTKCHVINYEERILPTKKLNGYCHVCRKGTRWLCNRCKETFLQDTPNE